MKTISRALFASAFVLSLAVPSHALFGWGDTPEPGPLGAVLADVGGNVTVKRAAGGDFVPAAAQTALDTGDVVKVAAGGRAIVVFLDGSKMQLTDETTFALEGHSAKKMSVRLDLGTLQAWITKQMHGRRYQLRTPTAVAAVRGTEFQVVVDVSGQATWDLFGGALSIADAHGNSIRIEGGQHVVADPQKGLADAKVLSIPPAVKMAPPPVTPAEKAAPPPAQAQPQPQQTQAAPPPQQAPPPSGTSAPPPQDTTAPPPTTTTAPPSNPAQDTTVSHTVSPSSP